MKLPSWETLVTRNPERSISFISKYKAVAVPLPDREFCVATEGKVGLPWGVTLKRWREISCASSVCMSWGTDWSLKDTQMKKYKWLNQIVPSQVPTPCFWILLSSSRGGAGKIQNLYKLTHAYSTWVPGAQTELGPKVNWNHLKLHSASVPTQHWQVINGGSQEGGWSLS